MTEQDKNTAPSEEEVQDSSTEADSTESDTTPSEEKTAKPSEEKGQFVPQSTIDKIYKKIEDQDKINAEQQEKITMLTAIADKGRLHKYENDNADELISSARIHNWKGKLVLGWSMVKDEVGVVDGVLREKQTLRIVLDAGEGENLETEEVDYLYYFQNVTYDEGEIIEKSSNKDGNFFILMLKNGRKVKIDTKFIN